MFGFVQAKTCDTILLLLVCLDLNFKSGIIKFVLRWFNVFRFKLGFRQTCIYRFFSMQTSKTFCNDS